MVLDRVTSAAFDTAFYPSDLYYADIARKDGSFEDWNGRKDGPLCDAPALRALRRHQRSSAQGNQRGRRLPRPTTTAGAVV